MGIALESLRIKSESQLGLDVGYIGQNRAHMEATAWKKKGLMMWVEDVKDWDLSHVI